MFGVRAVILLLAGVVGAGSTGGMSALAADTQSAAPMVLAAGDMDQDRDMDHDRDMGQDRDMDQDRDQDHDMDREHMSDDSNGMDTDGDKMQSQHREQEQKTEEKKKRWWWPF